MLVNLEFESRSLRRSLGKCGDNTSLILGALCRGASELDKVCQRRGGAEHVGDDSGSCLIIVISGRTPSLCHIVSSSMVVS